MVVLTMNSAMLVSFSWLINGCVCTNHKLFQDISKVETITARLANAVAQVAESQFNANGPVLVLIPSEQDKYILNTSFFERLLKNLSRIFSVMTVDEFHYGKLKTLFETNAEGRVLQKPNIYVIPLKEKNEFQRLESVLQSFNSLESFNPGGFFILIRTVVDCDRFNQHEESYKYFTQLWKKNCISAILIVFSECNLQLTIVSGNPFSNENPCRTPEPGGLKYRYFNSSDDLIILDISKIKIRNLNGCLFTAGIIPAPPFVVAKEVRMNSEIQYNFVGGLEMEMKDVLSKKFNFTVKLDVSNGYEVNSLLRRFTNGTEVGIATDIKNHKIDFALGGVSPNYRTFYMFDFSHTYRFSSFSWYVPNPNIAPRWQIIFKTLSLGVWISSGAFLVLVGSLYFLIELHNYKIRKTRKFTVTSITFIELLCVGLGLSATQQPRGSLKVLFFSWAAFGLHWNMAYSCTLFDLLRTPPLEKEILTILDLRDSGLKVLSPTLYFQLFTGVDIDSVTRAVLNNKIICIDLNLCTKQLVTQRNISLMDRSEHVDYSVNFKVSKIHKLSENLISFGVSLMSNKGNPLSLLINEVVQQTFESGLVGKWERDTGWKFNYQKNTVESSPQDDTSLPLSVTVLQGAFFFLSLGLLCSSLVFLGELIISRCKKTLPASSVET